MLDNQELQNALQLLSQGKIEEADELFCVILTHYPNDAEALYGRACVARAKGANALAIGFAGQALQHKSISYYHIPLGLALYDEGHYTEGEAALKTAILLNPYDPRAHHALATLQEKQGEAGHAELSFRKAVELQPSSVTYWKELIRFYWQGQAYDQALNIAKDAAKHNPNQIEFLHELAVILYQLHMLGDAERVFRKIIKLKPQIVSAHANLGAILFQQNRLQEAKHCLSYAFERAPKVIETQVNLGLVEMGLGNLTQAKTLLQSAYQKSPTDSSIALNYGTILFEFRELELVDQIYRQLLDPTSGLEMTESDFHKVEQNLSSVLLAKGKMLEGWAMMESRHYLLNHFIEEEQIPIWNGKDTVKKLLIRVEQGLGDAIQFMRFIPQLAQNISVVIEAPKILLRFFELYMKSINSERDCIVIEKGATLPEDISHQVMLMSLPYLLQVESINFLKFDIAHLSLEIAPITSKKLKVGLCWSGNKDYRFDQLRSMPVSQLAPLLTISEIDFLALQIDMDKSQRPRGFVGSLPKGDILKTAQYIEQLDLVITVDTAIGHLAGSLGKPVWLLNRFGGDWRWYPAYQNEEGQNLWYSSLKQFQQKQPLPSDQAWQRVIAEVKAELENMIQDKKSS